MWRALLIAEPGGPERSETRRSCRTARSSSHGVRPFPSSDVTTIVHSRARGSSGRGCHTCDHVPPLRFLTSSMVCSDRGSRACCIPVPDMGSAALALRVPRRSTLRRPPRRQPCRIAATDSSVPFTPLGARTQDASPPARAGRVACRLAPLSTFLSRASRLDHVWWSSRRALPHRAGCPARRGRAP